MDHGRPGISRSWGHQIGILEEFTEFGCRLHGAEQSHRALGRHLSVVEDPFQILTWHSGTGADQVLDENAVGGCGVAELESRKQLGDRCVPGDAMFIDEFGEQQRGHRLRIRGDHEQRVAVWLPRTAQFLHSKSAGENNLAILNHAKTDSGYAQNFLSLLDEAAQLANARLIEGVRFLSCKRLTAVALGQQAAKNQGKLSAALPRDRISHIYDDNGPT